MIKALIIDVDGVIIGEKIGHNSPNPHPNVIDRLKAIRAKGISVSLCTAKPYYAVKQIIERANLHNLHIAEGGALVIDLINHVTLKTHTIDTDIAKRVIRAYLDADAYTEVYAIDEYLLNEDQVSDLTKLHEHILQRPPRLATSVVDALDNLAICKIMPIATDETDKVRLQDIFQPFEHELTLNWGVHPIALPHQFGIITTNSISKQQAVREIAQQSGILPSDMLGIGDSTSDWQFIKQCGYAGAVGNASDELKKLVATKGDQSFIGGSVDDNGVLDILNYFKL